MHDDPRYAALARYGLEKIATSAWRALLREGPHEVQQAIQARVPNAANSLLAREATAATPAFQQLIGRSPADRMRGHDMAQVFNNAPGAALRPHQRMMDDLHDAGMRTGDQFPTGALRDAKWHLRHQNLAGTRGVLPRSEVAQQVANQTLSKLPTPNLP